MKKFKKLFLTFSILTFLHNTAKATQKDENLMEIETVKSLADDIFEIDFDFDENNKTKVPPFPNNSTISNNFNNDFTQTNDIILKAKSLNSQLCKSITELKNVHNTYCQQKNNENKNTLEEKSKAFVEIYNKTLQLWDESSKIRKNLISDIQGYKRYNSEALKKHKSIINRKYGDRYHYFKSKNFTAKDKLKLINLLQKYYLDIIKMGYLLYYINPLFKYETDIFAIRKKNKILQQLNFMAFLKEYRNFLKKTHMFAMKMFKEQQRLNETISHNKKNFFKDSNNLFENNPEKYYNKFLKYINLNSVNFDEIMNEKNNLKNSLDIIENIPNINNNTHIKNFKDCNFIILNLKILKNILSYSKLKEKQINGSLKNEENKIKNISDENRKKTLEKYFQLNNLNNTMKETQDLNIYVQQLLKDQKETNDEPNNRKYYSFKSNEINLKNHMTEPNVKIIPIVQNLINSFDIYEKQKDPKKKQTCLNILQSNLDCFTKEYFKIQNIWKSNFKVRADLKKNIKEYENYKKNMAKLYNICFRRQNGNQHKYLNSRAFTLKNKLKSINLTQKYYLNIMKNGYMIYSVENFFNSYEKYKEKFNKIFHCNEVEKNFNLEKLNKISEEYQWIRKNVYFFGFKNMCEQETFKSYFNRIKKQKFTKHKDFEEYIKLVNKNFNNIYKEKQNLQNYIEDIKKIDNICSNNHINTLKNCNFLVFNLEILKNILEYSNLKIKQIEHDMKNNSDMLKILNYKKYKKENNNLQKYVSEIFKKSHEINDEELKSNEYSLISNLDCIFDDYKMKNNAKNKTKNLENITNKFENEYLKIKKSLENVLFIRQNLAQNITNFENIQNITFKELLSSNFTAKNKLDLINTMQKYCLDVVQIFLLIYDSSTFFKIYEKYNKKIINLINEIKNKTNFLKNVNINTLQDLFYSYKILSKNAYDFAVKLINFQKEKENFLVISKKSYCKKNENKELNGFSQYILSAEQNQSEIYSQIEDLVKYSSQIEQIPDTYDCEKHIGSFESCNFIVFALTMLKTLLEYSNLKFIQINDSIEMENYKIQNEKKLNFQIKYKNPYEQINEKYIQIINKFFKNKNNVEEYLTLKEKYKFKLGKIAYSNIKKLSFLNKKRKIINKKPKTKNEQNTNSNNNFSNSNINNFFNDFNLNSLQEKNENISNPLIFPDENLDYSSLNNSFANNINLNEESLN